MQIPFGKGRMISHSKSKYRERYPYNPQIFFNGNIFIKEKNQFKKIWYGDLDLAFDGEILKKVAKENNIILYVVPEHDGRFDNLNLSNSWNTDEEIIIVNEEYIENFKKKRDERNRQNRVYAIKKYREKIIENKKLPVKDLKFLEFVHSIKINFEEIYSTMKNTKKNDYKDFGYFSAYALDELIRRKINLENYQIDPSAVWLSRKTNKKLRKIDLEIEKRFNKNFRYSDFKREVTCNYCVPSIEFLNNKKINENSFKEDFLYIKNNLKKEYFV